MQNPITKKSQQGFTLIELLIVVAIIGILAAIAIPQYSQYRTNAQNSAAESELRNMQTALEGHYATESQYPNNFSNLDTFESSSEVNVDYSSGSSNNEYEACSSHSSASKTFYVNSTMSNLNSTISIPSGISCS